MTHLIPAAPGWYVRSRSLDALDPIIAWTPAVDLDGGAVLLPYVPVGTGMPPEPLDLKAFPRDGWQVVYLPNHDPATETTDPLPKPPADSNPGIPTVVPCPVCKAEAVYDRPLDRYVHYDGSDNRKCWLAVSRGETTT